MELNKYKDKAAGYGAVAALLLANFVANFLFIFNYKLYSDDWSTFISTGYLDKPFSYLIMDSQRPLQWCFFRLEWLLFQNGPLGYHIVSLLTSSAILILIFLLFKELFPRLGFQGDAYPFLGALAYVVLFNKDQLYPWAVIGANDMGIIFFLLSFLLYIHRDRRHFIYLSLAAYFIGLCFYEIGIMMPAVFLIYDLYTHRDFKPSFLFAIPLAASLLIRVTQWFGFGHTYIPRGFGDLSIQSLPSHLFNVFYPLWAKALNNVYYSLIGLGSTDAVTLIFLLLLDVLLACIVFGMVDLKKMAGKINIKILAFPLLMVAVLVVPHVMQGTMDTRHMVLVDIAFAMLIVLLAGVAVRSGMGKLPLAALFVVSLLICQGLYVNWVVSGDIQEHVYQYISKNAGEIGQYDYVYFNATSFADNRQNQYRAAIAEAVFLIKGGNRGSAIGPGARLLLVHQRQMPGPMGLTGHASSRRGTDG